MSKSYIDIDSAYRNRTRDPIPSSFTVNLSQSGQTTCGNGLLALDPISNQVPIYPSQSLIGSSQLQLEPLAFYTETLQAPLGGIVERQYLPYMFSVNNSDTLIRLDELPIASTESTTTDIELSTDLERNTVPLGEANNFYVGDFLELIDNTGTSEFRKIIGFTFDNTETVLQAGNIVAYTLNNGSPQVELRLRPYVDLPPSNVDRFYQGKTIRLDDGTERLITNFFINSAGAPIIVLNSPLDSNPIIGTFVNILTTSNWFAKIESPFTSTLSSYPAYRSPLPDALNSYTKVSIANINSIYAMASVRHTDTTIGLAFTTLRDLYYVTSTDSTGTMWNTPSIIYTSSAVGGLFLNDSHGIGLTLISGNPAITFTELLSVDLNLLYIRASNATGTAWNAPSPVNVITADSVSLSGRSTIRLASRPDSDGTEVGFPMIAYTDVDGDLVWAGGSGSLDAPTWTLVRPLGIEGDAFDIRTAINVDVTGTNWTDGTDLSTTVIFYRDTGTGEPRYIIPAPSDSSIDGTWVSTSIQDEAINLWGNTSTLVLPVTYDDGGGSVVRLVDVPALIFQDTATNYFRYTIALVPVIGPTAITFSLIAEPTILVTEPPAVLDQLIYLISPLVPSFETDLVYVTNSLLTKEQINIASSPRNVIDVADITVFTVLPTLAQDDTLIFTHTDQTVLNVMVPTTNTILEGVQYRIRTSIPNTQGFGGTASALLDGSTTTVQLPVTASTTDDIYNGSYIWIYNQNVFTTPSPFQMFNDFRQIKDYDGATQTITVTQPFSGNVDTLAISGGNTLNWEILSFTEDNFNPLVYQGSQVSVSEMVCYEMTLISLILPNVTLSTGQGNRIAFYPYVYVKFSNSTTRNYNIFHSNSPHATNVLFKVPITNIVDPVNSTFVNLNGNGMSPTIKFKPYDNFEFSVLLPNGELFETLVTDTQPPFPPDPNVQISATFEFRRIEPNCSLKRC